MGTSVRPFMCLHSLHPYSPYWTKLGVRPRECLRKSGCARKCLGKCSWGDPSKSDLKVSKKCLLDTFKSLFGPGLKGSLEHSLRHSQAHPAFRGHSLCHFVGDFGPEGPEDTQPGSSRLSQRRRAKQARFGKLALSGPEKGSLRKGSFHSGGISRISEFSRISKIWSDSPFFSTVWRFSRISRNL